MWERFRQSWRDSFFADKVLFPSKVKRMWLYLLNAMGVITVALGVIPLYGIGGMVGVVVFLLIAILGIYLVMLSCMWWAREATRYIVKKEA